MEVPFQSVQYVQDLYERNDVRANELYSMIVVSRADIQDLLNDFLANQTIPFSVVVNGSFTNWSVCIAFTII